MTQTREAIKAHLNRRYTPEEIENFRRIRAEVRELEAAELARVDEVCKRYQW